MFLGTHTPKLDDKGRVILPAKFWSELESGIVITRGQERCLYVFSTREFEELHDRIRQAPVTSKQARDYLRLFLSGANAEVPDTQRSLRKERGGDSREPACSSREPDGCGHASLRTREWKTRRGIAPGLG